MNRVEDISKETVIVSTTAAFSGKGNVLRIAFEDIQSNMANNSHILRRMIFTDAAAVFMEGHVQTPVKGVFNPPMFSDCVCKCRQSSPVSMILPYFPSPV